MAVITKITVFWYVMPSDLVDYYRYFGGMCWLHLLGKGVILLYPDDRSTVRLFYPEDGGSTFLWNVGNDRLDYRPYSLGDSNL
jgi:hypothetical protein